WGYPSRGGWRNCSRGRSPCNPVPERGAHSVLRCPSNHDRANRSRSRLSGRLLPSVNVISYVRQSSRTILPLQRTGSDARGPKLSASAGSASCYRAAVQRSCCSYLEFEWSTEELPKDCVKHSIHAERRIRRASGRGWGEGRGEGRRGKGERR